MSRSPLIFFGNERLASGVGTTAPLLQSLIDNQYPIPLVVVSQGHEHGRRKRRHEIEEVAARHEIEVVRVNHLNEITDRITNSGATAGVLAAFGRMVPQTTIDLFEFGILNLHPSLLPRYRGSTPIESAILHGDTETGISLMSLVQAMDAGPVYAQKSLALSGKESKQELYNSLSALGAEMLIEQLPGILDGSTQAQAQSPDGISETLRFRKADGEIDWAKPALEIERHIRAFLGWPGSFTTIKDISFVITQASVAQESGPAGTPFALDKQLGVYCGEGALVIEKLKPAGKKEMDSKSFLNGYPVLS